MRHIFVSIAAYNLYFYVFAAISDRLNRHQLFIASLEGLQTDPSNRSKPPWLPWNCHLSYASPETWNNVPSVDMTHLQELAHTILGHKFFKCLKRKKYK